MGLGHKFKEVKKAYTEANKLLGDLIKVRREECIHVLLHEITLLRFTNLCCTHTAAPRCFWHVFYISSLTQSQIKVYFLCSLTVCLTFLWVCRFFSLTPFDSVALSSHIFTLSWHLFSARFLLHLPEQGISIQHWYRVWFFVFPFSVWISIEAPVLAWFREGHINHSRGEGAPLLIPLSTISFSA